MPENEDIEKADDHYYARPEGEVPPDRYDTGMLEVDPSRIRLAPPIGGWLILPAIGLVLGPILNAAAIVEELRLLKSPEFRAPGLVQTVYKQCLAAGAVLAYQIFVAVMFFRKKAIVPTLMIALFAIYVGFELLMTYWTATVVGQLPPEAYAGTYRAAIGAIIWIPYFLVSQRVKATFR